MFHLNKNHYIILGIFLILGCIYIIFYLNNKNLQKDQDITYKSNQTIDINSKNIDLDFSNKLFLDGKLEELIEYYESRINLNSNDSEKILLVNTYLSYGNSFYKEQQYSEKALAILDTMSDNFEVFYLKGYAYEIVKNYPESLKFYTKAINLSDLTLEQKAVILNQIGHIYDLQGDLFMANEYYNEAENLGIDDETTLVNKGRYEYRIGNYDSAEKYFTSVIMKSNNKLLKAEMYYDISSIYIKKGINNFDKNDLTTGIEVAKNGIKEQSNYPFNYLNMGIGYFHLGNLFESKKYFTKVIELYPKSILAHKYLGIYYYTVDDFDNAISHFEKELQYSLEDVTLMLNEREENKNQAIYDLARSFAFLGDEESTIKYLDKLLLDSKNITNYVNFLIEYKLKGGAFSKIQSNELFLKKLAEYDKLYNQKSL